MSPVIPPGQANSSTVASAQPCVGTYHASGTGKMASVAGSNMSAENNNFDEGRYALGRLNAGNTVELDGTVTVHGSGCAARRRGT